MTKMTPEEKRKRQIENARRWRERNPEKYKEASRKSYLKRKSDPEKLKRYKEYNKEYKNRPERKEIEQKYRRESVKRWIKKQMKTNPEYRIKHIYRARIRKAIKKGFKSGSTLDLLGVKNILIVKNYIQKKFQEGMCWDNYGEWHIDHIIPCASFDLTKESEQKKCFHYTNLQPLWAKDNLSKGCRLNWKGGK
jgi:hypothetical protein